MTAFTASEAKRSFSDILNRVAYAKEQITITRRGKTLALIVPAEAKAHMKRWAEEEEDRLDLAEAEQALAEAKAKGERPIPWEKVKARWDSETKSNRKPKTMKKSRAYAL